MMKVFKKMTSVRIRTYSHALMFWPLIVAGGRLVFRVIMNTWDMIED